MSRLPDNAEDYYCRKHDPDNWERVTVFQNRADKGRGHDKDHGDTEKGG